jgi:hypothetical protein
METHDIHDFLLSSQRAIEEEYARIQKRATEDPGTAGDQGEENWATLLRQWLPSYFHIVTKGRILTESGYASPQVDVLVLMPSYPKLLLDKKLYLAGGIAAAFECKTTLKAEHIKSAIQTCAKLRKNLPKKEGSPYVELNSTIPFGLLAHSHSWKGEKSEPLENVQNAWWEADLEFVSHPIQSIDFICVADLANWHQMKMTYLSPNLPMFSKQNVGGYGSSSLMCAAIGQELQKTYFSPIGALLSGLYSKLAWTFHDMRSLEEYFRRVDLMGSGQGQSRHWPITIYSEKIRERIHNGHLSNGLGYDEWSVFFM